MTATSAPRRIGIATCDGGRPDELQAEPPQRHRCWPQASNSGEGMSVLTRFQAGVEGHCGDDLAAQVTHHLGEIDVGWESG